MVEWPRIRQCAGADDDLVLLDSTPVECGRSLETSRRSDLADVCGYGYCKSHSRWFWGMRLHLLCAPDGTPRAATLVSADRPEREVALPLLARALQGGETIVCDKGRWLAKGLDPSTIRNTLMPLRAMYRRALSRGEVSLNPTNGIELPAVRGRRERIATPEEAAALIAAAPENDRALWATAFYAGLRRGELMALRWEDIDLEAGLIRVERAWDMPDGVIEPKSRAGKRSVPIATVLREHLAAHALRSGRRSGLVFGRTDVRPSEPTTLSGRGTTAWKRMNMKRNAKALSTYMGHSSITITLDR